MSSGGRRVSDSGVSPIIMSSVTVKVVPFPGSLWQSMVPSIRLTMFLTIAIPRPVP